VQIIGWMYQYYNSELKDDTFALLKKNIKITKERIPAATQLFTPDWIVRYMVENSLGRLWYEGHPSFDKSEWKYYLDEAPQEPEVELQLKKIRADYASINPEDIKVIDPCMGSGHILVYAFDVLLQIYTSCGWSERDAAKSIIENNLYGLDIDDRAGQLAYFAVMMKARKYNRRILNGAVKPNVLAIQDSGFMTDDFIAYVAEKDTRMKADLTLLRSSLKDAKEYGSILHMPKLNFAALYERIDIISRSFAEDIFQISYQNTAIEQLLPLVKQAEIMAQKYDVVVTNPPYMSNGGMSAKLSEFTKQNFPDSKADMYAVFIEKCGMMLKRNGYQAMITQHRGCSSAAMKRLE
ncbi:MAG: N-6 DNA methylase, partial [Erysipelotrichaceae bacterium]|nr:N-6 DNA methylase [Erysipelotrichaceae bacterium]